MALPRISLVLFHGSFAEESLVLQSVLCLTYKLCPVAISNGSYHPNGRNHMEQFLSLVKQTVDKNAKGKQQLRKEKKGVKREAK